MDVNVADDVVAFCCRESVSLIVVGPEVALADGFVDKINGRVPVFGPTKAGALLEASKIFSKTFMRDNDLPTAKFAQFDDTYNAKAFIEKCNWDGIVVKADGLAAGKGVVVAEEKEAAATAAEQMLAEVFRRTVVAEDDGEDTYNSIPKGYFDLKLKWFLCKKMGVMKKQKPTI
ncbi:phosphoribosylamine--glycine ligase [Necator americanus]|uniref:Phosphoribosylamine--glycine ligase n=1 Tax=Necator americanus TaxID=51031 RepID=W2U0S6_NECAM|nr:phosphoribosylamine--glycine ligase [Necator americanus]ETN86907.1 phosphoribosylamine--glycine ligase [Necator americanus]